LWLCSTVKNGLSATRAGDGKIAALQHQVGVNSLNNFKLDRNFESNCSKLISYQLELDMIFLLERLFQVVTEIRASPHSV